MKRDLMLFGMMAIVLILSWLGQEVLGIPENTLLLAANLIVLYLILQGLRDVVVELVERRTKTHDAK